MMSLPVQPVAEALVQVHVLVRRHLVSVDPAHPVQLEQSRITTLLSTTLMMIQDIVVRIYALISLSRQRTPSESQAK